MNIATETELKAYVQSRFDSEGFNNTELKEIFDKFAETVNAKKQGYRSFKSIVKSERFSTTESVTNLANDDKFIELDKIDIGTVTVQRMSVGQFRVTTSYDNANTANLIDNGIINIQTCKDLASNNYLRSGDTTFVGSDVSVSHKVVFQSSGVFDIYTVASKGTENENLVDVNFYLTIELYNMPTV